MGTPVPKTIRTNLRAVVMQADKQWAKDRVWNNEYKLPNGDVKPARVDERGPYDGTVY